MKYLNKWQKFIKINKRLKKLKEHEMAQLMKAINFHETQLTIKALTCLKYWTKRFKQFTLLTIRIEDRVNANMLKFYFDAYRKAYKRAQKRKRLSKVAGTFFREQRRFKCFLVWQQISQHMNAQALAMNQRIWNQAPYAAEILLEKIAFNFYIKHSTGSDEHIPDILKFHFYAS